MSEYADEKRVETALERVRKDWAANPGSPAKVVGFTFTVGEDHHGDPAVYVTALLDDATTDEEWTSDNFDPIADRVRAAVADEGVDRFVYMRYRRPRDLTEAA